MKEFRIGEIAKLMNVSKEMIRYYERQGVISPYRSDTNNYRVYSTTELATLLDVTELSQFGLSLADIADAKNGSYSEKLSRAYHAYVERAEREIDYLVLKKQRAEELLHRVEVTSYNVGRHWIDRIPAFYRYAYLTTYNDGHDEIDMDHRVWDELRSAYGPFVDAVVVCGAHGDSWCSAIEERYVELDRLPALDECVHMEEGLCLCTMIDMGQRHFFSHSRFTRAIEDMRGMGYEAAGDPWGLLVTRGIETDGLLHSYIQVMLPIAG